VSMGLSSALGFQRPFFAGRFAVFGIDLN
jgi:hypothetical protein